MGIISKKLRNYLRPSKKRQIIPFSEIVEIDRESADNILSSKHLFSNGIFQVVRHDVPVREMRNGGIR